MSIKQLSIVTLSFSVYICFASVFSLRDGPFVIWGGGLEFYLLANIFCFRHRNKQIIFAVAADKQFFFLKPKNKQFFFVIPFLIYFRDIKAEIKLRSNAIYDSDNKSINYLFSKKLDKDWENLSAGHFVNKILKNIKK